MQDDLLLRQEQGASHLRDLNLAMGVHIGHQRQGLSTAVRTFRPSGIIPNLQSQERTDSPATDIITASDGPLPQLHRVGVPQASPTTSTPAANAWRTPEITVYDSVPALPPPLFENNTAPASVVLATILDPPNMGPAFNIMTEAINEVNVPYLDAVQNLPPRGSAVAELRSMLDGDLQRPEEEESAYLITPSTREQRS